MACTDDVIQELNSDSFLTENVKCGRLSFTSKEELASVINQLKGGHRPARVRIRSLNEDSLAQVELQHFTSLLEANRKAVYETLSPEQLLEIESDEEGLEFCLEDSIVADAHFAALLNARREIEVNDTVYRYLANGVIFTPLGNASMLDNAALYAINMETTSLQNTGNLIRLPGNVGFIPINYGRTDGKDGSSHDAVDPPSDNNSHEPLVLEDGISIPASDIRNVGYYEKGDGNWFHRTFTGFFGRNVVAIKKFSSRRKLNLSFYDQNYIVYANIGTNLKMQKKVCGIWWNIKAEEMRQGWSAIELKYTFSTHILPQMPQNPFIGSFVPTPALPDFMRYKFPFEDAEAILLNIPFVEYELTNNDINKAFKSGMELVLKRTSSYLQKTINRMPKPQVGLYLADKNVIFTVCGPSEVSSSNCRSMKTKFYSKWLPGNYVFGFSFGEKVHLENITLNAGNETRLHRGVVYGAIKYKGKWLGARIAKNTERK